MSFSWNVMFVLFLYSLQRDGRAWEPSLGRAPTAYRARMGCTGLGLLLGESKAQQGAMGQLGRHCGNTQKHPTPPRIRVWQEERAAQEPGIPDRSDSCRHKAFPTYYPGNLKQKPKSLLFHLQPQENPATSKMPRHAEPQQPTH